MAVAPEVAPISIKLPPFWPADPQIWFAQVEAQFETRGIRASKTKFDYIVSSLSPEFATEVQDLILSPPAEEPYDALRTQLIKRTAASEQRRLQQLFNTEELGNRKPTQLLRRMQQLLGEKAGTVDGSILRELFLQRLPSNVRMVLVSSPESVGIDDLATLADRITEVATSTSSVSSVEQSSQVSSELDQLRAEVADLRKLLQSSNRYHRRPRSATPSRRSSSPAPSRSSMDLCWYHSRFGDAARKCRSPCSKAGNTSASH